MRRTVAMMLAGCVAVAVATVVVVGISGNSVVACAAPCDKSAGDTATEAAGGTDTQTSDTSASNDETGSTDGVGYPYFVYSRLNLNLGKGAHVTMTPDGLRQCTKGRTSFDLTTTGDAATDSQVVMIKADDLGSCGVLKSYEHWALVVDQPYKASQRIRLGQVSGLPPWPYRLECTGPSSGVSCQQNDKLVLTINKA
jgi:hypothetical protein